MILKFIEIMKKKKKQERDKKKSAQFDFFNLDVFTRFKGNVDKYQRKKKA